MRPKKCVDAQQTCVGRRGIVDHHTVPLITCDRVSGRKGEAVGTEVVIHRSPLYGGIELDRLLDRGLTYTNHADRNGTHRLRKLDGRLGPPAVHGPALEGIQVETGGAGRQEPTCTRKRIGGSTVERRLLNFASIRHCYALTRAEIDVARGCPAHTGGR